MMDYDAFEKEVYDKNPDLFLQPCGFEIGPGWYNIIRTLCASITMHLKENKRIRSVLLQHNPHKYTIPDECPQVTIVQIKEKFGGLRVYYDGGDGTVEGMVTMAESWAMHTCEKCGNAGKSRNLRGWIAMLCDVHHAERLDKMKDEIYE